MTPQRFLVLGNAGSGKSTLARQIGAGLRLPVVHIDKEYWQPGWHAPDPDWFAARMAELAAAPRWVIEGNYSGTLAPRLARADAVLFLDMPTPLCMFRVLRRQARGWRRVRADMAPGCPERWDLEFLIYVWRFRRDRQDALLRRLRDGAGNKLHVLRGPGEVAAYVERLPSCERVQR